MVVWEGGTEREYISLNKLLKKPLMTLIYFCSIDRDGE
jgi:hypothetical protein